VGLNKNRVCQLATAACLALAGSLPLSGLASAQAALVETPQIQRPVAPAARARINGFDWLARKSAIIPARFSLDPAPVRHQIGTGSYICSPAGFGHKSRCYSN
jgi:hypothetical protein